MPDALIPQFRVGRRITRQRAQHFTVQMLPTALHIGKSEDPQDNSMQWLCEFTRRKVYKLYKDEPRVHIPVGIIICVYCLCTGISASERHPARYPALRSVRSATEWPVETPNQEVLILRDLLGTTNPCPYQQGRSIRMLKKGGDMGSVAGMRRLRPPEEEHGMRLPPLTRFSDDNSRRRSPSSSSSPHHPAPYAPLAVQGTQPSGYDSRTQLPSGSSSGPPGSGRSASSVMSLENIVESGNIQG
ncbi:hypothetical protein PG989_001085 [Apiospora arundinis]